MLERIPAPLRQKLINLIGEVRARQLVKEVLDEMQKADVEGPDECFSFGSMLCKRGGMFEVLGKSIQTKAILNGAQRPTP